MLHDRYACSLCMTCSDLVSAADRAATGLEEAVGARSCGATGRARRPPGQMGAAQERRPRQALHHSPRAAVPGQQGCAPLESGARPKIRLLHAHIAVQCSPTHRAELPLLGLGWRRSSMLWQHKRAVSAVKTRPLCMQGRPMLCRGRTRRGCWSTQLARAPASMWSSRGRTRPSCSECIPKAQHSTANLAARPSPCLPSSPRSWQKPTQRPFLICQLTLRSATYDTFTIHCSLPQIAVTSDTNILCTVRAEAHWQSHRSAVTSSTSASAMCTSITCCRTRRCCGSARAPSSPSSSCACKRLLTARAALQW